MQGRRLFVPLGLMAGLALGCAEVAPPREDADDPPTELAGRFDPAATGTIQGQVIWDGDVPDVPPFRIWPVPNDPPGLGQARPNPHAPLVDPSTHGVVNAVVFLRGIDLKRSRPWDHPPVRVEMRDYQIDVCQGDVCGPVGFVRRGEAVEMVSRQEVVHTLHAGGAAFWTLAFPDPERPLQRRLSQTGVVDLSSGAGWFWMHSHLFVVEHPYIARTDDAGRFLLPQVPEGRNEMVCWLPSWHVRRQDRDPESGRVFRVTYQPPVELVQPVTVEPGATRTLTVRVSADSFAR